MIATKRTPAVAYYRMSSDQQDTSIGDQRIEVQRLARERGFEIVHEFVDEGVSGWKSGRDRKAFTRMIHDAEASNSNFTRILCWDQDRFSRFPPLEAAFYWFRLQRAGVRIVTCGQGEIDFNDLGEFLKAAVNQHSNAEYCVKLAKNSLRGRLGKLRRGLPAQHFRVYGYDRQYFDAAGQEMTRVANDKNFRMPRHSGWTCRLVPSADPEPAATVRRIFDMFANEDRSLNSVARALNEEGIKSPKGHRWLPVTIKSMLRNRVYLGHLEYGKKSFGRFSTVGPSGEQIDPPENREGGFNEKPAFVFHDYHAPLIDSRTFEIANRKLLEDPFSRRAKCSTSKPYLLTGLLICGHCGCRLTGQNRLRGKRAYVCNSKANESPCYHSVGCERIDIRLIALIKARLRAPDIRNRLRSAVAAELEWKGTPDTEGIKSELARLKRAIERATENALLIEDSPDVVRAAFDQIKDWKAKHDRLKDQLRAKPLSRQARSAIDDAMRWLDDVDATLDVSNIHAAREAIRRTCDSVVIYWTKLKGRRYSRVSKVVVNFRVDGDQSDQLPLSALFDDVRTIELGEIHDRPNPKPSALGTAVAWVQKTLAGGPKPIGKLVEGAKSCGITRSTLYRALNKVGAGVVDGLWSGTVPSNCASINREFLVDQAAAWIKGKLRTKPQPIAKLLAEGKERGFLRGVVYKALRRLGATSKRENRTGGRAYWRLPETKSGGRSGRSKAAPKPR